MFNAYCRLARLALVFALVTFSSRAFADCKELAGKALSSEFLDGVVEDARFDAKAMKEGKCNSADTCYRIEFAVEPGKAVAIPGFEIVEAWKKMPGDATCKTLYRLVYKRVAKEQEKKDEKTDLQKEKWSRANTPALALAAFKTSRTARASQSVTKGAGQIGVDAIASEALQILGQIVVDRASAKAYLLLKKKLETALQCGEPTTKFQATCHAIKTLRIEDLAMTPDVLFSALVKDLLPWMNPAWPDASFSGVFKNTILTLALKPNAAREPVVRAIIDALLSYVADAAKKSDFEKLEPPQRALVLGVLAYAKCLGLGDGGSSTLATCDVGAVVDELAEKDASARPAAKALATRLVSLSSASKFGVPQLQLAVDTLFASGCMLLAPTAQEPELTCPDPQTVTTLDARGTLAFVAAAVTAVIDRNAAQFVLLAANFVKLRVTNDEMSKGYQRAFRILGALLDYAATYASSSEDDESADKDPHEQRTEILESLTREMTDRTGREGDWVWSLGGALRGLGGVRVSRKSTEDVSWAGPLSLPLGLAVTQVRDGVGFHAQVDVVDLGNYLAFDNGPEVKEFEVGDALALGLTLGGAAGKELPFVFGVTGSYAPSFVVDPDQPDNRGAFSAGVTLGIHVPLLDLN